MRTTLYRFSVVTAWETHEFVVARGLAFFYSDVYKAWITLGDITEDGTPLCIPQSSWGATTSRRFKDSIFSRFRSAFEMTECHRITSKQWEASHVSAALHAIGVSVRQPHTFRQSVFNHRFIQTTEGAHALAVDIQTALAKTVPPSREPAAIRVIRYEPDTLP